MRTEFDLTKFVGEFLKDEVNWAVLETGTDEQIRREIWRDVADYFFGPVDDEIAEQIYCEVMTQWDAGVAQ